MLSNHKIWHALYLKSRQEKKVAMLYERDGLDYYLPLAKRLSIWSDRKKWVTEPLFRGYIFVPENTKLRDKYIYFPGVVGYVKYNGKDAIIKQKELQILQEFIEKGYHVEAEAGKNISEGDLVTITSGALKGIEGKVLELQGETYFLIAVESIGQILKVKITKEMLLKTNK